MRSKMNWFGFGCALAALACLLFMAFYKYSLFFFSYKVDALLMIRLGQYLLLLPLIACLAMAVSSLLFPKMVRMIVGGVALLILLILMFSGGAVTQSISYQLANSLGADISSSGNTIGSVVNMMLKPGLGVILATLLCIAYIILEGVMDTNARPARVIKESDFFA